MPESDLLHVVAVPYLPLDERAQIGTWQLIPFGQFAAADAASDRALRQARQLFEYYERPDSMTQMGAVARRGRRTVGERIQPSGIEPLHLALVLAVLDSNPTSGVNRGHSMMTSDNAVVWGHRIDSVGHVAADYGSVVGSINFGMRLGEPSARGRAPIELASPIMGRGIDARYASAMFGVLNAKIDEARRLAGACRWLDVAWRNTPSMDRKLRILALYSGFEALLRIQCHQLRPVLRPPVPWARGESDQTARSCDDHMHRACRGDVRLPATERIGRRERGTASGRMRPGDARPVS